MKRIYYRDNFIFVASTGDSKKKYHVYTLKEHEYITSFGDKRYQQYYDKIGHYKALNHKDKNRRRLYYLRHGKQTEPLSAKYFSHNYLW